MKHVLLVEDHTDTRMVLGGLLSRCGCQMVTAKNAAEARARLDEMHFDFLLAGVPNIVGMQDPAPYLPDYHAESDTLDKVDAREAKAAEAALAALVWDVANREARLGARQSRAEVEALIQATHLDDQMKAFGQWDAWIGALREKK